MPDNKEQYYDYLKGAGADVPPTYDSFNKTLSNRESSEQYYNYLKENDFDAPDNYESFQKTLGITTPTEGRQELAPTPFVEGIGRDLAAEEKQTTIEELLPPVAKAQEVGRIDEQMGVITDQATQAKEAVAQNNETLFSLKAQIDDPNTPEDTRELLIDEFNQTEQSTTLNERVMQDLYQQHIKLEADRKKLVPEGEDDSIGKELVGSFGRGSAGLGEMLARTPSFIYDIAAAPQNYLAEKGLIPEEFKVTSSDFAENVGLPDNQIAEYYNKLADEGRADIQKKYDKGITEYFEAGEYEKGFKSLANQVAESAPITIGMMMTGAGGVSPMAQTLAGGAVFGAGKKEQLEQEAPHMAESAQTLNALSTGLFEGIFEQAGVAKLGVVAREVFEREGKEAAKAIVEEGFKETYGKTLKKYIGIGFEESLSEAATQFAENVTDKFSGAKPDLDLSHGVSDAAIVGLGSSVAYSSPIAVADVMSVSKSKKTYDELEVKKEKLEEQIANPATSDDVKKIVSEEITDVDGDLTEEYYKAQTEYNKLSDAEKKKINTVNTEVKKLESALEDESLNLESRQIIDKKLAEEKEKLNKIKPKEDAIQKPSTEEIPVREETRPSEEVGEKVPVEKPTEEGKKEVAKPAEEKKPTPVKEPEKKERRSEEIAKEKGVEFATPEEAERFLAEESESPLEVAESFVRAETPETPESMKSYKDEMIGEANIQITNEEFNQYFDPKAKSLTLAKRFINEGRETPLDVKLQELSDQAGIEITPNDFVAYMERVQEKPSISTTEPIKKKLRDRYFELTGKKLTPKLAQETITNEAKKVADKANLDYAKNIEREYTDFAEAEQGYYEDFARQAAVIEAGEVVSDAKRGEKVGERKKPKEEAETIGISKAKRAEMREELGMKPEPKLSDLAEHTREFLHNKANELVNSGEVKPMELAMNVLSGKTKLDDLGSAIIERGVLDLSIQRKAFQKDIYDARANADSKKENLAYDGYMETLADIDILHTAVKGEATEAARLLASLKKGIKEDYSIDAVYSRFKKANKGQPLDKAYIEHLTQKVLEIDLLSEKVETLEQKIKDIPKAQRKKPTKRAKSKKRLNELKDERKQIFSDWKKYRDGGDNPIIQNSVVPLGDKDIVFLARLALNYAETGVVSVQELSRKLRADVKKNLNMRLTDEEVDAILHTEIDGEAVINSFEYEQLEESVKEAKADKKKKKRALDDEQHALDYANRSKSEKIKEGFIKAIGVPRSLRSSFDLSAPFRQGLVGTVAHPGSAKEAFKQMFRQVFSEKNYQSWLAEYKESSDWELAEKSGLFITDDTDLSKREEEFISDWAEKIPLVGRGVKASSRAYSAYLNALRADIFKNGAESFKNREYTFENDPEVFEQWADFTNNITGRGKMPTKVLQNAAPLLTTVIWSPSLIVSRINLLSHKHVVGPGVPRAVRIKAAQDMLKFWAFTGLVLTLAGMAGADIEEDPRSSDFGKIKVGYRRFDVAGGFGAYVTLMWRLLTKQRKSTKTGELKTISRYLYPYKDRADLVGTFTRYKLSPVVGAAINIVSEADAMGVPTSALKEAGELFKPLSIVEALEALEKGGGEEALIVGLPSMFGIGVGVYGAQDEEADLIKERIQEEKWKAEDYEGNMFSRFLEMMTD